MRRITTRSHPRTIQRGPPLARTAWIAAAAGATTRGYCRSALRGYNSPERRNYDLGFRLAASIEGVAKANFPASAASSDGTDAPPPAKAPFDEATAKKHQQAWADYLGLPVEKEITLPGGEKLTLVLIPPGEFLMGSTDEERAKFLEEATAANDQMGYRVVSRAKARSTGCGSRSHFTWASTK